MATAGAGARAGLHPRVLDFGLPGSSQPLAVNLVYVDNATFGITFHYHEDLKDYIKAWEQPKKARWDSVRKAWIAHISAYDDVVYALETQNIVPVTISHIPDSVRDNALAGGATRARSSEVTRRVESIGPLMDRLYGFQRDSVRFGVERGGRVLLGDDMGLGKTVQALALAACYAPEDWPLLIVAPSSMKLVWLDALRAWLPPALQPADEDLLIVKDGKTANERLAALAQPTGAPGEASSSRGSVSRPRIVIISYDMVKRVLGALKELKAHTIIADESHHLKSPKAQRTRAMQILVSSARRAIFVSGTPALSRPIELYPQLNMLRPGLFGTFDEFGMRYCDGKPALNPQFASSSKGMDYRGASCLEELKMRLEKDILIRRTKAQVLTELPEKIRKRVPVEPCRESLPDIKAVKSLLERLEKDVEAGRIPQDAADSQRQQLVSQFFRVTGPSKVPEVLQHVQALLDAGKKVLVFAHHKEVLDRLQQGLTFGGLAGGSSEEAGVGRRAGGDDEAEDDDYVIDLASDEEDSEDEGYNRRNKQFSKKKKKTTGKRSRGARDAAAGVGAEQGQSGRCVRIDGSVTQERRKAAVDAFQEDHTVRAALLSINAAGVGLTLTAANVVVFAELWWTPGALIQAEDRAHRLGQRGALEVHYCTAIGTADDLIWKSVGDKLGVVSSVLGGVGTSGGRRRSQSNNNSNLFEDMRYVRRYENVQQRLAEEAEAAAGRSSPGEPAQQAQQAMERQHSISSEVTRENPGAAYGEVVVVSEEEADSEH